MKFYLCTILVLVSCNISVKGIQETTNTYTCQGGCNFCVKNSTSKLKEGTNLNLKYDCGSTNDTQMIYSIVHSNGTYSLTTMPSDGYSSCREYRIKGNLECDDGIMEFCGGCFYKRSKPNKKCVCKYDPMSRTITAKPKNVTEISSAKSTIELSSTSTTSPIESSTAASPKNGFQSMIINMLIVIVGFQPII